MKFFFNFSFLILLSSSLVCAAVLPGFTDYGGNKITYIPDGARLEKERYEMISSATNSIYFSTFIMTTDEVGKKVADLLCEKAKSGVEVRAVIDSRGSKDFQHAVMKLRECGANTIYFKPNFAMYVIHHKFLIVDGERMIMGGSNAERMYHLAAPDSDRPDSRIRQERKSGWYDADYKIEGPGACAYHYLYRDAFKHYAEELADKNADLILSRLHKYGSGGMGEVFKKYYAYDDFRKCVSTVPKGRERITPLIGIAYHKLERPMPILSAHLEAIKQTQAGEKIRLYSPFFVPNKKFAQALVEATQRGVEVTVLTNSLESNDDHSKAKLIFIAMVESIGKLVNAGVKVNLWTLKSTMHRKGGVYGKVAFFGSDNLDNRGQEYSDESVAFTDSKKVVDDMVRDFDADLKRGSVRLDEVYINKVYENSSWFSRKIGKWLKKYF